VGYIDVFLNGVLLASSDYTASNGTTVVLTTGASAGNILTTESFYVSSVLNAIPNSPASVGTSNIQSSVTLTTPTIDKINTSVANTSLGAGNASIMKNRIINGAMVIDQRNAGAAVTVNSGSQTFAVDRFYGTGQTSDGVYTLQQSSTAPAGFVNSVVATVTTADSSIGATQNYLFRQRIEGYNIADLNWGSANAKTVTLSFWVRSSLTGTFGGTLHNGNGDRFYPYSYTISAANTWEQKTITIAGDTTGTWETTNGIGLNVIWSLGTGSTYLASSSAWTATTYTGFTGQTNLIGTSGATFYITGVQLEVGSSATGFEYRQFGTELNLCQRYYQKTYDVNTVPGTTYNYEYAAPATAIGTGNYGMPCGRSFLVSMRATPTITTYDGSGNAGKIAQWSVGNNQSYASVGATQNQITAFDFGNNTTFGRQFPFAFVASAEL
jgi:hypothetical protein